MNKEKGCDSRHRDSPYAPDCSESSCNPVCIAQKVPTLDQILSRAQNNVKEFEFSLPDFMCDEKITSQELLHGKAVHTTIVDSVFIGTQNKSEQNKPFTESREIKTVDGRQPRKNQQLEGPFLYGGGFSSILDATFAERNIQ